MEVESQIFMMKDGDVYVTFGATEEQELPTIYGPWTLKKVEQKLYIYNGAYEPVIYGTILEGKFHTKNGIFDCVYNVFSDH